MPGVVLLSRIYYGPRGVAVDTILLALATGKVKTIVEDAGYPTYASSGHLLFTRGDTLLAAPFDLSRLEVTGGAGRISGTQYVTLDGRNSGDTIPILLTAASRKS